MRISKISIDDPKWFQLVESHPDASPFHLPAWASVLADCYRFDAFVLAANAASGELLAGLPILAVSLPFKTRRWVSLPFTDACPVLARPGIDPDALAGSLREYVRDSGVRELEVRAALTDVDNAYAVDVGVTHELELPEDPAGLRPNKGHRYSRNRAIRKGVQVTHGDSVEDVETFYRLHTLTRRRHGVPVQPRRLFDLIHQRLLLREHGFVAVARHDGEAVAAAMYLSHNATLVAKYHASNPGAPDVGAGYLVDWETMVYGCLEGYRKLDMGRSDADAAGLRLYKSSWGAVERPLIYTSLAHTRPNLHRPYVGDLPKQIIRRSPPWVCRALGEALYRWSA